MLEHSFTVRLFGPISHGFVAEMVTVAK